MEMHPYYLVAAVMALIAALLVAKIVLSRRSHAARDGKSSTNITHNPASTQNIAGGNFRSATIAEAPSSAKNASSMTPTSSSRPRRVRKEE